MYLHRASFRIALIVALLTFFAVLISSYTLYFYALQAIKSDVREYLRGIATIAAKQVDGDAHKNDAKNAKPSQEQALKLASILESFPNVSFIYTSIQQADGNIHLISAATPPHAKAHNKTAYDEEINAPALKEAFATKKPTFSDAAQSGAVSAYMPFYDTKGEFAGIVGVGLDSNDYIKRIARAEQAEIICIFIGSLISVFTAVFVYFQNIKKNQFAEELRRSEERLQLAITGSNDGLWDWNVVTGEVYYSPSFMELTGHHPAEFPRTIETFQAMLHPDDREHVHAAVLQHFRKHDNYGVEYRLKHKNGGYIWCHARGQASWDSAGNAVRMTGFTMNISDRKRIEEQLQKATERMRNILDCMSDGILGVDLEGCTTFGNKAAEAILGFTIEEILGRPQHGLIHHHYPDGREYPRSQCHIYQAFSTGKTHTEENEVFWRKDGTAVPVEYTASPTFDDSGSISGAVVVFRDITERRQGQQQLRDYAHDLELKSQELAAAKLQADEATRLKSEFLANMSHEIRTPMNGIIGMTNLLLGTDLNILQRGYAETVVNSAEALLQIINDILDFSKIEANKIELEHIPFDLHLLCEEVCEMMAYKAAEKQVELLLHYSITTPRYCMGDPGRIRQVLFNLVNNALKFTAAGHILLSVACRRDHTEILSDTIGYCPIDPRFRTEKDNLYLHFEVEDTGIGIPQDKLDLIFNKFSQADQSTARKFGGTGLGLAICKELVRMMGGEIGVTSSYGIGSTFWFEIVLKEDKNGGNRLPEAIFSDLTGVRVLVAEDNETARLIYREQLLPYGAEICEAVHGKAALELLSKDRAFDAIIIDRVMPEMDGETLAKTLKADPAVKHIPLVMVTSEANRGDKRHFEAMGFAAYLNKPLANFQLRDAVDIIVKSQRSNTVIPMITQHTLRESQHAHHQHAMEQISFAGKQILIVEDNPVNQLVASAMLQKYGCLVTTAGDGEEAVKQVEQRSFDLILMDCQMPRMDGYEATIAIRQMENHRNLQRLPIIALTANAMRGDRERCLSSGMDDYLAKPVRQSELEQTLLIWLGYKQIPQNKKTLSSSHSNEEILDSAMFQMLADLLGDTLKNILTRHLETADQYVNTIKSALAERDFKSVQMAAHPLKSSSQQIGALQVAKIAAEIERLAMQESPDIAALNALTLQLPSAQERAAAAVRAHITG